MSIDIIIVYSKLMALSMATRKNEKALLFFDQVPPWRDAWRSHCIVLNYASLRSNNKIIYVTTKQPKPSEILIASITPYFLEAEALGSGYQIALRDLEVRGAGNVLGREQSGPVNAVGLNLYMQMLSESVEELKNPAMVINSTATMSTLLPSN